MRILTIDPGIDCAAAGVFDPRLARRGLRSDAWGWAGAAHAFLAVDCIRPKGTDAERCVALAAWVPEIIASRDATRVVVETPSHVGTYGERAGRQRSGRGGAINARAIGQLYQAIAVIRTAALLAGVEVVEYPAQYPKAVWDKKVRHETLNHYLRLAGKKEVAGNADMRDAAFLGLMVVGAEISQ